MTDAGRLLQRMRIRAEKLDDWKGLELRQQYTRHIIRSMAESSDPASDDEGEPMTLCIAAECAYGDRPAIAMCSDFRGQTGNVAQPSGSFIGSEDHHKVRNIGAVTVLLAGNPSKADELIRACKPALRHFVDTCRADSLSSDIAVSQLITDLRDASGQKKIEITSHFVAMRTGMTFQEFKKLPPHDYLDVWAEIKDLNLGADLLIAYVVPPPATDHIIIRLDRWGDPHFEPNYGVIGDGAEVARAFLCMEPWEAGGATVLRWHEPRTIPLAECLYRLTEAKQAAHLANPSSVGELSNYQILTAEGRYVVSPDALDKMHGAFKVKHKVPKIAAELPDDQVIHGTCFYFEGSSNVTSALPLGRREMTKRYCDACGRELGANEVFYREDIRTMNLVMAPSLTPSDIILSSRDLCENCTPDRVLNKLAARAPQVEK